MFGFIQKQCPEDLAQLYLRILDLFTRGVCIFLNWLIFKRFYCFCMYVSKHFTNTGAYISKSKRCYISVPSRTLYFTEHLQLLFPFREQNFQGDLKIMSILLLSSSVATPSRFISSYIEFKQQDLLQLKEPRNEGLFIKICS